MSGTRQFRFRVWDTRFKQWCLPRTGQSVHHLSVCNEGTFTFSCLSATSKETGIIEQWTGLIDKDGTPVYEGDIVSQDAIPCIDSHGDPTDPVPAISVAEVCWDPTGWMHWFLRIPNGPQPWLNSLHAPFLKVLGNVHQHSHLLSPPSS